MFEPYTIDNLPVEYFFDFFKRLKKGEVSNDSVILVKLNGLLEGYLTFEDDAKKVSKILNLQLYKRNTFTMSKSIIYTFIRIEDIESSLEKLDDEEVGYVFTAQMPEGGYRKLAVKPMEHQTKLF